MWGDWGIMVILPNHHCKGVCLQVEHSLKVKISIAFADAAGQLIVADVAMKSFEFWVVVVCVPTMLVRDVSSYSS